MVGDTLIVSNIDSPDFQETSPIVSYLMVKSYFPDREIKPYPQVSLMDKQEYLEYREKDFAEKFALIDKLIGQIDENNDLLTHKFAKKHDIWMHAQGVPGSHVIVRLPEKNTQPPLDILMQAASIAAYFSNAKNSKSVPVNYTEVRYVRKPRKSSAGTALMTRSKTLFVEPKKYI